MATAQRKTQAPAAPVRANLPVATPDTEAEDAHILEMAAQFEDLAWGASAYESDRLEHGFH